MYMYVYFFVSFLKRCTNPNLSYSFSLQTLPSGFSFLSDFKERMMSGNGQLSVPPGFRFHPTDEELLYYYLRKKVSYEAIDLDVIREIDLNKLEPWDLKDKCWIGSGTQNEWYFFSHKDKKYPTGTRTNRATNAGFWKATGRDKAIHLNNSKRIGMRKTLVFYTGRAPHGQKSDWIMYEYRLDDDNSDVQEDGWVVCRVFKKKNQTGRGFLAVNADEEQLSVKASTSRTMEAKQIYNANSMYDYATFDGSMHLPQLFCPESLVSPPNLNSVDIDCSQNLLSLTSASSSGLGLPADQRLHGDWSFLDRLLASHQTLQEQNKANRSPHQVADHLGDLNQKFSLPYLSFDSNMLRFSK